MSSIEPPCEFCGLPVNTRDLHSWHRVYGWERKGQNGGSDVALREKREGWAHPGCVRMAQNGLAPGQAALL